MKHWEPPNNNNDMDNNDNEVENENHYGCFAEKLRPLLMSVSNPACEQSLLMAAQRAYFCWRPFLFKQADKIFFF